MEGRSGEFQHNPTRRRPVWLERMLPRRLIVTFHGIGPPTRSIDAAEAAYWVAPQVLSEAIRLAKRGILDVTFDDGNESDYRIALPLIAKAGIGATFFVLSGRLDQPGSLSREQVREMAQAGMTIGSHGWDHVDWRKASDVQLERELGDARKVLEDCLGQRVDRLSVPFGAFDARVLAFVTRAGYRQVYTSSATLARDDAWLMPRHTIHDRTSVLQDVPIWLSWRARLVSGLRNELRGRKYRFSTSTAGPSR